MFCDSDITLAYSPFCGRGGGHLDGLKEILFIQKQLR